MIQDSFAGIRSRIPDGLYSATSQWAFSRRGRIVILSSLLLLATFGLLWQTSPDNLPSYRSLSNFAPSWQSNGALSSTQSPLLIPSDTTLNLESGKLAEVPSHLKKGNPSFHLVMMNPDKNDFFCRSSLASMILDYPPPTLINSFNTFAGVQEREAAKVKDTWQWLKKPAIKDDDLVLLIDGNFVWFQMPSAVLIKEYETVLADANARLVTKYGNKDDGTPRFTQSSVWAAMKTCDRALRHEAACAAVPDSFLPSNHYGAKTDQDIEGLLHRPKYLYSAAAIGPAKDIRAVFERAWEKMRDYRIHHKNENDDKKAFTAQMAISSVFGDQEYARSIAMASLNPDPSTPPPNSNAWHSWLSSKLGTDEHTHEANITEPILVDGKRYDYGIGLDYASSIFQFVYPAAPKEFVFLHQDNMPRTMSSLRLPPALLASPLPFSNSSANDRLSPNKHTLPYIKELALDEKYDELPIATTKYASLPMLMNTYNPSIPAALIVPSDSHENTKDLGAKRRRAQTVHWWDELWYHPYARALLRRYLRAVPQGVRSFHNAAVGGDRGWDVRGGEGGVWTSDGRWMEWGVEVCEEADEAVFGDGRGRWLKEREKEKEEQEKKEKEEKEKQEKEQKEKDEQEKKNKEEQDKKDKEEKEKQEKEQKEKEEKEKNGGKKRIRKRDMYKDYIR